MSNLTRGTAVLVETRRQTRPAARGVVRVGAPNVQDLRTRFEAVRKYLYDNMLKLKTGELANFDDLHERFQRFDQTNTDSANPELYTFEQKLQFWEERRGVLEQLPEGYQDAQPGVHISPETAESLFGVGVGVGAGVAFGMCGLVAAVRHFGAKKKRAT